MENIEESLSAFRKYLDNIPDSKLDKILSTIDETGIEGPSVEEYFSSITAAVGSFLDEPSELCEELDDLFTDSRIERTSTYEFQGTNAEKLKISELKGVPDTGYYPNEEEFSIAA